MAMSFDDLRADYAGLWQRMQVRPERAADVDGIARRLLQSKARYQQVAAATRVPWFVIAVLHSREASGRFDGVLHNGERIIGTGQLTRLVPRGRGPFATWEASAVDALTAPPHCLDTVGSWTIERACYEIERYNGFGYRLHYPGVNSPYLWSFTTLYACGKYVGDGRFDPRFVDAQCGTMAILRRLMEIDPSVRFDGGALPPVVQPGLAAILGIGSVGADVAQLQTTLTGLGFPVGTIDGEFGPDTAGGLRAFQLARNLPATGAVDDATRRALTAPAAGPTIQPLDILTALLGALRAQAPPAQASQPRAGEIADVLPQIIGALLGRPASVPAAPGTQTFGTQPPAAPILSPIDKLLGGEALTGKKTALAVVAYAIMTVLQVTGVVSASSPASQIITQLITAFGALGGVSKVDRVIQALGVIAARRR